MKITTRRLRRLIREALTPSLPEEKKAYAAGLKDQAVGRYDHYFEPESLRDFYDAGQDAGFDSNPRDNDGEEDELTIADTLPPAHYALAMGTDNDVYEGDKFKVSPVQTDPQGTRYQWWKWGNMLDPVAFVLDPNDEDYMDFEDQDGKRYTPEQLFQALAGGKTSRFRFPKELYV